MSTISNCPECEQNKHDNCDGTSWDHDADAPAACPCWEGGHGGVRLANRKRILLALNTTGRHVYAGTVRPNVKVKRRARGRMAKASRKVNR